MATVLTGTPALVATACGQLANACLAVALDVRFAQAHAILAYPKQPVMAVSGLAALECAMVKGGRSHLTIPCASPPLLSSR
jgi:hypothetical protein